MNAEVIVEGLKKVPWKKVVENAPKIWVAAQGMWGNFQKKPNDGLQKPSVENLDDKIGQLEDVLKKQADLLAELTEQSAGMIEKIEELEKMNQELLAERQIADEQRKKISRQIEQIDEANQKLVAAHAAMANKLNIALVVAVLSILAAAAAILR